MTTGASQPKMIPSPAVKNEMKTPKIEVQFDNLTIEVEKSEERQLSTLINYTINFGQVKNDSSSSSSSSFNFY